MRKYYTQFEELWQRKAAECEVLSGRPQVHEYKNAVILPLRKSNPQANTINVTHLGGVCDEDFHFVTGAQRTIPARETNRTCMQAYMPRQEPVYRDETVVFGGVICRHFGHMLADGLSRMWWYTRNKNTPYKLVFVLLSDENSFPADFFEIAGLTQDRYEIITQPTRFAGVIVPDQAMFSVSGHAHKEWTEFFCLMRENVKSMGLPPGADKIYLTRTRLANKFEINEEYYENFFARRGYRVISPEKLTLAQQINAISCAKNIVCTMGTLSHAMVFAQPEADITILLRRPEMPVKAQIIIDKVCSLNTVYIQATRTFLPSSHVEGTPLYACTPYFKEYLEDKGISCGLGELDFDIGRYTVDFLKRWAENYTNKRNFARISKKTMADVLYMINKEFNGREIDTKLYKMPDYQKKIKKLEKELKETQKQLTDIKNSRSWRITRPLRRLSGKIRKISDK